MTNAQWQYEGPFIRDPQVGAPQRSGESGFFGRSADNGAGFRVPASTEADWEDGASAFEGFEAADTELEEGDLEVSDFEASDLEVSDFEAFAYDEAEADEAESFEFGDGVSEYSDFEADQGEQEDEWSQEAFEDSENHVCHACGHEFEDVASFFRETELGLAEGELRQDFFAEQAELGLDSEDFEMEGSGSVIETFARTLGEEWARRRGGKPSADAIRTWLLSDHGKTMEGVRLRWGSKVGKGKLTTDAITRAWMISREQSMYFQGGSLGVRALGPLAPPSAALPLVSSPLIGDSKKAPVAPLTVQFAQVLKRRFSGYCRLSNYPGHGGGKFDGRGYSLDIYIKDTDSRGFYDLDAAVQFLRVLHEAATECRAQWRIIYNDFLVADRVNRSLGKQHVIFMGKVRTSGKRVTGLNWHGPAPLILHFHLDLAPLGASTPSAWKEVSPRSFPSMVPGNVVMQPVAPIAAPSPMVRPGMAPSALGFPSAGTASSSGLLAPVPGIRAHKRRGFLAYGGGRLDAALRRLRTEGRLSISDTEIETLQLVSRVESSGLLAAVQSYDSAYMSFGFMQYTILHGELQELIRRVPAAFARHGIELSGSYRFGSKQLPAIRGAAAAAALRAREWTERFLRAALDAEIVAAQAQMALASVEKQMARARRVMGGRWSRTFDTARVRALIFEAYNNRPVVVWGNRAQGLVGAVAGAAARVTSGMTVEQFISVLVQEIHRAYRARNELQKGQRLTTKILAP